VIVIILPKLLSFTNKSEHCKLRSTKHDSSLFDHCEPNKRINSHQHICIFCSIYFSNVFHPQGSSSGYNSLKTYKKVKYNCIRVTEISVAIILEIHVSVSVMLVEILINKIVIIYSWFYDTM